MTNYTVPPARTTRLDLVTNDTLTVDAGALFNVSGNNQTVRIRNANVSGVVITNNGTIRNSAPTTVDNPAGGRAIRFEDSIPSTINAAINNGAQGVIESGDDVIQVAAGTISAGTLRVTNSGVIRSTAATSGGQALDLAGMLGASVAEVINNAGATISGASNDAVRFGRNGTLVNAGTINGGSAPAYAGSVDGVNLVAGLNAQTINQVTVTNNNGGQISGDRHGVNGGLNSVLTVINSVGATITGRNGSGVGSDGSAIVTNRGTITGAYANIAGSDINSPGVVRGSDSPPAPDGINDGDGDGIDVDFSLTLDNYGMVRGAGSGGHGADGLANNSEGVAAGGGTIRNYAGASITGVNIGIAIDNGSQGNAFSAITIVNDGAISGGTGAAILITSTFGNIVDNGGSINGVGGLAIRFGAGNDVLKVRNGSSITGNVDGAGGVDTLDYSAYNGEVSVNLGSGSATGLINAPVNFENVIGGNQRDTLSGNANANVLSGGGETDTLVGGLGNDTLLGGAGLDVAVVAATFANTTFRFRGTSFVMTNAEGVDRLFSIEGLAFTDRLIFRDAADGVDDLWYLATYRDVAGAGIDPDDHFNGGGRVEGRNPNAFFDRAYYLQTNPDVAAAGLDPWLHFIGGGWTEGRNPSAAFNVRDYLQANPDVRTSGENPLIHYLRVGMDEGRSRYAIFDDSFYLASNPDIDAALVDPYLHWISGGRAENRDPHPLFDADGYLATYTDVAAAGLDPLTHYLTRGWQEGRDPSTRFDTTDYLNANPDVAAAGINPLLHYLSGGRLEGRVAYDDGVWG